MALFMCIGPGTETPFAVDDSTPTQNPRAGRVVTYCAVAAEAQEARNRPASDPH